MTMEHGKPPPSTDELASIDTEAMRSEFVNYPYAQDIVHDLCAALTAARAREAALRELLTEAADMLDGWYDGDAEFTTDDIRIWMRRYVDALSRVEQSDEKINPKLLHVDVVEHHWQTAVTQRVGKYRLAADYGPIASDPHTEEECPFKDTETLPMRVSRVEQSEQGQHEPDEPGSSDAGCLECGQSWPCPTERSRVEQS